MKNNSKDLIIKLNDNFFQYAIVEKDELVEIKSNRLGSFDSIDKKINLLIEIIKNNPILIKNDWSSVKTSVLSTKYTLVPNNLFKNEYRDLYLQNVCSYNKSKGKLDHYHHIKLGFYNVFSIEKKIHSWLKKSFKKNNIFHEGSSLIENFYKNVSNNKKHFFIYFDDEVLHVLIFEKKLFNYYNFFQIKKNKYLNYIFLIINEFKIDQEKIKMIISGKNSKTYFNKLNSYFNKVSILDYDDFKLANNENNFIGLLFNNNL